MADIEPALGAWQSVDTRPHNLPAPMTSLVGRSADVTRVIESLGRSRMVTLVGPPGVGKTRLALRVAVEILPRQRDGAWFVDLAPVGEPTHLVEAVAAAVSTQPGVGEDVAQRLRSDLADQQLLLILDNCEHLLGTCAEFIARLAPACPGVTILATSRQAVGVVGEMAVTIRPLAAPEGDEFDVVVHSDAARLFASRVPGGLELSAANAGVVGEICRRLDGIPLALELGAGRVGEITLAHLRDNLERRFELLQTDRTGGPPRQRSLRASLEWSYDLLSEPERALLQRLSVFVGSIPEPAAVSTSGLEGEDAAWVRGGLSRLVDSSWLVRQCVEGEPRYRLYQSIRRFAREKLTDAGMEHVLQRAHARWHASLVHRADRCAGGPEHAGLLASLGESLADVRAAMAWSVEHDPILAARLAGGMTRFWVSHGQLDEAASWLDRVLALDGTEPSDRAMALWGAGLVGCLRGDRAVLGQALTEGLAVARHIGDGPSEARLLNLAGVAKIFAEPADAIDGLRRAAELARIHRDPTTLASSLAMQGFAEALGGDLDIARQVLEEALDEGVCLGANQAAVMGRVGLGLVQLREGCLAGSAEDLDAGWAMAREQGLLLWAAVALALWAEVDIAGGQRLQARRHAEDGLDVAQSIAAAPVIALCQATLGEIELALGDPDTATRRFEQAQPSRAGREQGSNPRAVIGLGRVELDTGNLAGAQRLLDHAVGAAGRDHGTRATALYWLGRCASRQGDHAGALWFHREALAIRAAAKHRLAFAPSLEAIGVELAHQGETATAGRILGAASELRAVIGLAGTEEEDAELERARRIIVEDIGAERCTAEMASGARAPLDRLVPLADRGRGRRRRPLSGWLSLTPTELRVIELLADHLTNAEIGQRLLMAPETVKTHLAHVYDKLGVRTRREVANEARCRSASSSSPRRQP